MSSFKLNNSQKEWLKDWEIRVLRTNNMFSGLSTMIHTILLELDKRADKET